MSKAAKTTEDPSSTHKTFTFPEPVVVMGAEPNLLGFNHSHLGNAERLVHYCRFQIRYCGKWKCWMIWDKNRWIKDQHKTEIHKRAKKTIRAFFRQAKDLENDPKFVGDKGMAEFREASMKFALASESDHALDAMVKRAQSEDDIPIQPGEFDSNIMELNVKNGVVDLRTGTLTKHHPHQLVTKICVPEFDPSAKCPRFLEFLGKIMLNDLEVIGYVQRSLGYALTGKVSEKSVFCFHGPKGNNGKTTLLELVKYILGDYSALVMVKSLMAQENESLTTLADLADLEGARMVITSEVDKGQVLAEGKIKYFTSDSTVKVARKGVDPYTFMPTHKIFMDCNHKPKIIGTDEAIWSRIKLITFPLRLADDEIDKSLPEKLKAEASGILTWLVQGCLDWQALGGLEEPPVMKKVVNIWRTSSDPLQDFLDDECTFGAMHFVPVPDMWARFVGWCTENGIKSPPREDLYSRLKDLNCEPQKGQNEFKKTVRGWKGVKLN